MVGSGAGFLDSGNLTLALVKVLSMILTNRLESFAKENKLIDDTQIGFKKGSRTVDHMFILTTLIDKYVKNLNRHCMCVC